PRLHAPSEHAAPADGALRGLPSRCRGLCRGLCRHAAGSGLCRRQTSRLPGHGVSSTFLHPHTTCSHHSRQWRAPKAHPALYHPILGYRGLLAAGGLHVMSRPNRFLTRMWIARAFRRGPPPLASGAAVAAPVSEHSGIMTRRGIAPVECCKLIILWNTVTHVGRAAARGSQVYTSHRHSGLPWVSRRGGIFGGWEEILELDTHRFKAGAAPCSTAGGPTARLA